MIVYYTGTGNSAHCAKYLARRLDEDCLDCFAYIKNGVAAELSSERPYVFVSPTYGWQLPRIFAGFIRSARLNGSREAYFVMTCGSEIGNAGKGLRALCAERGLDYRGVLEVVMPENYIALFSAPGPEEAKRIIGRAAPVLEHGAELIRRGEPFPERAPGALDRLKSGIVNSVFYKFVIRDKAFTVTDRCVSCGKCAEVCPTNNITLSGGRPVYHGKCTHCMACICRCPAQAIEYGRSTAKMVRYYLDE